MDRRHLFVLLATIVGSGIVILDGTVVNVALPKIAMSLHASFADLQWIVDGYLLSLSALILLGGSLGDIFGRKRVYLIGLVGFGFTSLLCGLAPNVNALIWLRVLQGVSGALLVPGGLAIINTNFPAESRGAAIGRWAAWSAIAAAIGPLLGGFLLDSVGWRSIFFINVPLVMVCLYFARTSIQETKDEEKRHVDIFGAIFIVLALAGIIYGLIEGPAQNWNAKTLISLIGGLICLIIFLFAEKDEKDPMVKLSLFKSRNFTAVNIVTFAMYGALGGFFFSLVIYIQTHLGYSSIKAGASLLPVTILMLTLSGRMGGLTTKYGPRLFMTVGPLLAALGMLIVLHLQPGDSYWTSVLPSVIIFGLGLALLVAPLTNTVMSSVPMAESGIASGINNAVSRVAGLIVVALLGVLGVANSYKFTIVLCSIMAAAAGILSFILIQNRAAIKASAKS